MTQNLKPYVLYEVGLESLQLKLSSGAVYEFPDTLANGRANYILFEELLRKLTGLSKAKHSDHEDSNGKTFEQKAYKDPAIYPDPDDDFFQTSASTTFGANNNGPKIKKLLEGGDYDSALAICKETGYNKNDFYIYTNTKQFNVSFPLRYFVMPKADVLVNLATHDPRLVNRKTLLAKITETVVL
ncbi:MAG: hypothetical protein WCL15_05140 [Actinomycetes bacterium]